MRYPVDPPTVEEIVLVMRHAGDRAHGLRLRGLIVVMWRAGLRVSETLALTESDLDADRGAILVRHGKGDRRREVGMDQWGWELLRPRLARDGAHSAGTDDLRERRPTSAAIARAHLPRATGTPR
jgi:site-specific recombinase XerD